MIAIKSIISNDVPLINIFNISEDLKLISDNLPISQTYSASISTVQNQTFTFINSFDHVTLSKYYKMNHNISNTIANISYTKSNSKSLSLTKTNSLNISYTKSNSKSLSLTFTNTYNKCKLKSHCNLLNSKILTNNSCECYCLFQWTGPRCNMCSYWYDNTTCNSCASGYTLYPLCVKNFYIKGYINITDCNNYNNLHFNNLRDSLELSISYLLIPLFQICSNNNSYSNMDPIHITKYELNSNNSYLIYFYFMISSRSINLTKSINNCFINSLQQNHSNISTQLSNENCYSSNIFLHPQIYDFFPCITDSRYCQINTKYRYLWFLFIPISILCFVIKIKYYDNIYSNKHLSPQICNKSNQFDVDCCKKLNINKLDAQDQTTFVNHFKDISQELIPYDYKNIVSVLPDRMNSTFIINQSNVQLNKINRDSFVSIHSNSSSYSDSSSELTSNNESQSNFFNFFEDTKINKKSNINSDILKFNEDVSQPSLDSFISSFNSKDIKSNKIKSINLCDL